MVDKDKLWTHGEYFAFYTRPENTDRLFELIDGKIVEKDYSFLPSHIATNAVLYLGLYLREYPLDYLTGADGGYEMDNHNTFVPDVAYISRERLLEMPEYEATVPPDLAVEVMSPTDRKRKLRLKAERYIEFGTKIVWLVLPKEQQIEVYEANEDVRVYGMEDTITGGNVLPGFEVKVSEIFSPTRHKS